MLRSLLLTAAVLATLVSCTTPDALPPAKRATTGSPTSSARGTPATPPSPASPKATTRGPTEDEAALNRARPYIEGVAALDRYRASEGCENEHTAAVGASIAELERLVSQFHTIGSFRNYEAEARDRHTALSFAFADEALARGCLDEADRVYRQLMSFYVGAAYSGVRDRARLGVEDVRARRSQVSGH